MFFIDGWMPLRQLWTEVHSAIAPKGVRASYTEESELVTVLESLMTDYDRQVSSIENEDLEIERDEEEGVIRDWAEEETAELIWDWSENENFLSVLSPQGTILRATPELMAWWSPSQFKGLHIDLRVGTVGSGSAKRPDGGGWVVVDPRRQDSALPPNRQASKVDYGPFLGCPVIIPMTTCRKVLADAGTQSQSEGNFHSHSFVADEIVRAHDDGFSVTKKWAKEQLAADMKQLEFQATWKMAVDQRPELSKPGPRGPR